MVHLLHPNVGLQLALDAVSSAEKHGLWPLHAGVNSGPMVKRDGDFFGAAVNVASRVADAARPGEVVVTEAVARGADDADVRFVSLGEFSLKNVQAPVPLFRAERRQK